MCCMSKLGCKAAAELLVVAGPALQKCSAVCESSIEEMQRVFLRVRDAELPYK